MKHRGAAHILKSPFLRNFALLFTGSAAAQLLPVLASPLLSRLYTPAQFGEYAMFVSGVNILSQLVCLKYDFAILTAKTDDDAAVLLRLCVALSAGVGLLLTVLLLCFGFTGRGGAAWLYLLPCGALFTGLFTALNYYCTRFGLYRRISLANILRCAVMLALQLCLSGGAYSAWALSAGQAIGYAAACPLLWGGCRAARKGWGKKRLRAVALGYNMFPKYTLPGAFCNTLAFGGVTFFLAAFYSQSQLGGYSLVNRILAAPLALISGAVGQVYTRELTAAVKVKGGARRVFNRVSAALALLAAAGFAVGFAFAPPLIAPLFGAEWAEAGLTLRVLLPMVAIRFVVSPLSSTGIVLGRQFPTMLWQGSLLLAAVIPAAVNMVLPLGFTAYLILQSILFSACYIVFYAYCAAVLKNEGLGG